MAQRKPKLEGVSDVVRRRVRELRIRRGYSARVLAERLAALGITSLDRNVLANFENGRRASLSIDELLGLALALDVAPAWLLLPLQLNAQVRLTPRAKPIDVANARMWIAGFQPFAALPDADDRRYYTEQPEELWRDWIDARNQPQQPETENPE